MPTSQAPRVHQKVFSPDNCLQQTDDEYPLPSHGGPGKEKDKEKSKQRMQCEIDGECIDGF